MSVTNETLATTITASVAAIRRNALANVRTEHRWDPKTKRWTCSEETKKVTK